ncbi:hypothetical protein F5Y03DRAFT_239132 [Xylaria venustula]|nr:hypothetical protein F5Y03DRAFT_239132 [Xylaria venustula]
MHCLPILFGLAAVVSATVPSNLKAAAAASNCTLPADFVVTDFTTFTHKKNGTLSTVRFQYSDPDTKIQTTCQRNSTSTPSGPSKNIYQCSNANIAFIYQTTGVAGLTITERACPGGSTLQFEASGLVTPALDCTDTPAGTICHANQTSLHGDFDSYEPVPTKAPARRNRATGRLY